jgi:hypothetical protein
MRSYIINKYAYNSTVIMNLKKKQEEKKSTIQGSDRLNDSLNQMKIKVMKILFGD